MTDIKTFRVDWYPGAAHYDFSRLEVDEIAVLMQIINAIYIENGEIENDPEHIARSIRKMTAKKAEKIIEKLIEKDQIYCTASQKIGQKMCMRQLKTVRGRRENLSSHGKKGAEKRWQNEENQSLKNGPAINDKMASTSTSTSILPPIVPQGGPKDFLNQPNGKAKRKTYQEKKNDAINQALTEVGYFDLEKQIDQSDNPGNEIEKNENRDHLEHDQSEL